MRIYKLRITKYFFMNFLFLILSFFTFALKYGFIFRENKRYVVCFFSWALLAHISVLKILKFPDDKYQKFIYVTFIIYMGVSNEIYLSHLFSNNYI